MAFGYTENEHAVMSSQTIVRNGVDVQLDVRRPHLNPSVARLLEDPTVSSYKREDNPTYLMYKRAQPVGILSQGREAAMTRLTDELSLLLANPDVDLNTLQ